MHGAKYRRRGTPSIRYAGLRINLPVLQLANQRPGGDVKRVAAYDYAQRTVKPCLGTCTVGMSRRPAAGNRADGFTFKVDGPNTMITGIGNIKRIAAYG